MNDTHQPVGAVDIPCSSGPTPTRLHVIVMPLLLDLFCKAGGAAMGYHRAGFAVIGVDIEPQPNYPFQFIQADAMTFPIVGVDVIHASPPCQRYSVASRSHNGDHNSHPDLVSAVRDRLRWSGKPFVIENVVGAPLLHPVMLCGTMFSGLRVIRHRLFESNREIKTPPHGTHPLCYTLDKRKPHYGKLDEMKAFVQVTGGGNCTVRAASDAMGIDWMNKEELNNAIPPAYTEWIGRQFFEA
ncbi:MAG TPA: DNA cytosine methyltransferase [Planctomycetaceae bacterium]|nr:DNA cytosine methyltransferase [Planctomycetaceae bacterium]